jgi:hypothetical protein
MLHALQHCRFVAFEFVGDNDTWRKALLLEQFAEKSLCGVCVSMLLHQDI